MMVLPMFFCQIFTVQMPSEGILPLSTKPCSMANAPTAAVRLPQLPLQSTKGLSMETCPKR